MNENLFTLLRTAASLMAQRQADALGYHVNFASCELVKQSGPFCWLATFDGCKRDGSAQFFTVSLLKDPARNVVVARVPYENFRVEVDLTPFVGPRPAAPKSQGQIVSEAVFANWQRARGC